MGHQRLLILLYPLALAHCNSYGLHDKLENPAGLAANATGSNITNRLFVSSGSVAGNFGGIAAADNLCKNDTSNPLGSGNGNWKALLSLAGTRVGCTTSDCTGSGAAEHIDWPLKANTTYFRPDGVTIGTTNVNGLFLGTLTNALDASALVVFTGLTSNWTVAGTHCLSWTSNNMVDQGQTGQADQTGILWFSNTAISCDLPTKRLYCVQQ